MKIINYNKEQQTLNSKKALNIRNFLVLPSPKGDGLFEVSETEKKMSICDVHCLKAVVYFFSVLTYKRVAKKTE